MSLYYIDFYKTENLTGWFSTCVFSLASALRWLFISIEF